MRALLWGTAIQFIGCGGPSGGENSRELHVHPAGQASGPVLDEGGLPSAPSFSFRRPDAGLAAAFTKVETRDGIIPPDWTTQVQRSILASEYHIQYQEQVAALQSPNRAQNLRITYWPDGFQLKPRTGEGDWHVDLRIEGIGKDVEQFQPMTDPAISLSENTLVMDHGAFKVDYLNDEQGMRQNFTVDRRPEGTGRLEVRMRFSGGPVAHDKGNGAILFTSTDATNGEQIARVWYKDLLAWDANGDTLEATASVKEDGIVLAVNEEDAQYPITIDPLSATANWSAESNQAGAQFGWSVATAGDVNGDGYSDVVVGAVFYDGGQNNEGRIFVYHGSATGLSVAASATREQNVADVAFGFDVSTAGDVNADGFSDVAVVEEGTSITTGRLFIYFGSGSGIVASASAQTISLSYGLVFWNVACAGDVNDDGFSDVVIGAPWASSSRGVVYVFHGGGASGLFTPAVRTLTGTQIDGRLGLSVSCAGDVNADGISDIVMSQIFWDGGQTDEGRIVAYYGTAGSGITGGIPASPNWTYEPNVANANTGSSVSFAGDVNGDGYGDIIVGTAITSNPEVQEGQALCFHGGSSGLAATPAWTKEINLANSNFGATVSGAGDINGDGYADVLIGAPAQDGAFTDQGAAYLYAGGSAGLFSTPSWTTNGTQASAFYGCSGSAAGDVNGDGYSDVIVGARGLDNPSVDEGATYVYHGSAQGLSTSLLNTRDGGQDNAQLGWSVSAAGDVNADGYSDVLMGAPFYDNGQADEGRAYLYSGSVGGLGVTASWTEEIDQAGAQFGYSVSTAGDVNGDSYSDVVIGANLYDNGETNEGGVFGYYGSSTLVPLPLTANWIAESNQAGAALGTSVASAGDVNGDGYSDVISGAIGYSNGEAGEGAAFIHNGSAAGLNASVDRLVESNQAGATFGRSVAGGGDVTGDGYGDVIIGADGYSNGQAGEGRVFLFKGSSTGVGAVASWTAESDQAAARFGYSVAMAGDVNGDGYSEVIIGADQFDNGSTNEGRVYVYHGQPITGLPSAPNWTAESNTNSARMGASVSKAGDVNGDGYGDVIIGAPGWGNGRVLAYYGSSAGLPVTASSIIVGLSSSENFGSSVSISGSQSGDGYSDVVVGAPGWEGLFATDRGRAYLFYGNGGFSNGKRTRQYQPNLTTPVQSGNGTFAGTCEWGIGQYARSWMGRRDMKLVWEIRAHGPPFSGVPLTNSVSSTGQSAAWTDVDVAAGEEIKQLVSLVGSSYPRWRARLRHRFNTMIDGQVFSRWYYSGIHDKQETSIKTDPIGCGPLPVELIHFEGACMNGAAELTWSTATEHNNAYFTIERGTDGVVWTTMARIDGAGDSQQTFDYAYTDGTVPAGSTVYYRLSQTDNNGNTEHFPPIALTGCTGVTTGGIAAHPNPTAGTINVLVYGNGLTGSARLECIDGTGRRVLGGTVALDQAEPSTVLDLSNLANGVYTLRLLKGDDPIGQPVRVVKQ